MASPLIRIRTAPATRRRGRRQRGVTLIEVMIVLAIGVMIGAALMTLFSESIQTRNRIERAGQKSEAGRYALAHLAAELRLAGFYGEFIPSAITPVLNTLCDAGTIRTNDLTWNTTANLPAAVRGIAAAAVTGGDVVDGCLTLPDHRAGTDVLVVWRADTCSDAGGCPGSTGLGPMTPRKKLYYVADCNDCSPSDQIPTLKEMTMDGVNRTWSATPVSLVPGVEAMRFEFGVDSHLAPAVDDGVVEYFGTANVGGATPTDSQLPSLENLAATPISANTNGDNWDDVLAVRISILVRDLAATTGYVDNSRYVVGDIEVDPPNDSFKRRVFSTTMTLTNVLGRRER